MNTQRVTSPITVEAPANNLELQSPTPAHTQTQPGNIHFASTHSNQPASNESSAAAHTHTNTFSRHPASLVTNGSSSIQQQSNEVSQISTPSNSSKSPPAASYVDRTPLFQAPSTHLIANNFSTSGDGWSASLQHLLPGPSHMTSAQQIHHQSNLVVHPSTAGHLADSTPVAVVAPAPTIAPNFVNTQPIPNVPTPAASSQHRQQQQQQHIMDESKEQVEERHHPSEPTRPAAPVPSDLSAMLAAAFAARPQHPVQHSHVPTLEGRCHCLVIDESKLERGSADETEFKKAMSLAVDRTTNTLEQHVRSWLQPRIPADAIDCVYTSNKNTTRQLHINFIGQPELGHAQMALPFLVRCGAVNASRWNKPCGDVPRHKLPEVIHLSCIPVTPKPLHDLEKDVRAFLVDIQLEVTAFWCPSRIGLTPVQQRRGQEAPVNIYVLPRRIDNLAETIERLHHKCEFWGGQVRVDCPNTPALTRCGHCLKLGHATNKCEQYRGLAIRLLMKEPMSYAGMKRLLAATRSVRVGYLGSSMEDRVPSRRVTFLFDVNEPAPPEQYADIVRSIMSGLDELSARDLLFAAPVVVESKHRMRECRECGSMEGLAHVCPFVLAGSNGSFLAAAAAAAGHQPHQPRSDVCRAWSKSKKCPRLEAGKPCTHKHPEDIIPTGNLCFRFQRHGHCSRGTTCLYDHMPVAGSVQQLRAPQPAVAAPPVAAVAPALSAHPVAHSSVPVSAPAAPAAPTQPPSRRKGRPAKRNRGSGENDDESPPEEEKVSTQTPAKKQKQQLVGGPAAPTSNPFAALVDHDLEEDHDMADDQPSTSTPATPKRTTSASRSSTPARTPSAPISSLSALGPLVSPVKKPAALIPKAPATKAATPRAAAASRSQPGAAPDEEMGQAEQ